MNLNYIEKYTHIYYLDDNLSLLSVSYATLLIGWQLVVILFYWSLFKVTVSIGRYSFKSLFGIYIIEPVAIRNTNSGPPQNSKLLIQVKRGTTQFGVI